MVPLLLMPPEKVETLPAGNAAGGAAPGNHAGIADAAGDGRRISDEDAAASAAAEMVPELMMPPETMALFVTKMPLPLFAVMCPALLILPPTEALLVTVMPVAAGAVAPLVVIVPVPLLTTLPLKEVPLT